MLANYHIHTSRCRHAAGTDEEYIQKAISEGLKILGFSDHAPYLYPNGYKSYYKMTPEESVEYFRSLRTLSEKYADKIKIYVGYEAEYYEKLWDESFEFWKRGPRPDYLILGQHFVTEEYPLEKSIHCIEGTDSHAVLAQYVDSLISGIDKGCFTYVAHPDVILYNGNEQDYQKEMSRLLQRIKLADIPIEINLLGLSDGRSYPTERFWQLAAEYSPKVILGCDAHEPERVAVKDEILKALRLADKFKLEIIDTLDLVDPFGV